MTSKFVGMLELNLDDLNIFALLLHGRDFVKKVGSSIIKNIVLR